MSEVVSGEAVVLDVPCARFPSRLLALLIDIAVQVALGLVLLVVIGATSTHLDAASGSAVALTAAVLIILGYPATLQTPALGLAPGQNALRVRGGSDAR